jgi:hypothetical protein
MRLHNGFRRRYPESIDIGRRSRPNRLLHAMPLDGCNRSIGATIVEGFQSLLISLQTRHARIFDTRANATIVSDWEN